MQAVHQDALAAVIFADDFESGDTSAWSGVIPPDPTEPTRGLFFSPTVLQLAQVGDQGVISLTLRDFPELLWGVEIYLSFDPTVLRLGALTPGPCPPPEHIVLAEVDNGVGLASYAVVPLAQRPCVPSSGDLTLFAVTVERIGEGASQIAFATAACVLSDGDGALTTSMHDSWVVQ